MIEKKLTQDDLEATIERLRDEQAILMSLLMKVTINCQRPQGRFGEDECQVCPACQLVEMKRAYTQSPGRPRRKASK
jgi:hypothetical protein